jgi:arginase
MTGDPGPVRLVVVPYDSGQRGVRMGAGPEALAADGAARLRESGHAVAEQVIDPPRGWRAELRTAFELHRGIAQAVADARRQGEVPLALSGNCNATLGVLAGLGGTERRLGLVWLDAHADFNTPDTDPGGFLDGQGLAMVVGRCWDALVSGVPGFVPVLEHRVLLVGARSLGDAEHRALRQSTIGWVPPARARQAGALAAALGQLARDVDVVHFHLDLDVHDPSVAQANDYAEPAREVQGPGASAARRRPAAQRTQGTAQGRRQQRAWSPAIRRASMTCNTGAAKTRWRRLPQPRRAGRT